MKKLKFIILALILSGCAAEQYDTRSIATLTPVEVRQNQASFVGNDQNSGVLGYDKDGFIMHQSALDRYKKLAEKFGVEAVGINGDHLTKEGMVNFLNLNDKNLNK